MKTSFSALLIALCLTGCMPKGQDPRDPYEAWNRKVHRFNTAFDATILKPPARLYKYVIPGPVRVGIANFYDNLFMIPTVANDVLQAEWNDMLKDSWRFALNSTLGIAGVIDVASSFGLPPHSNDLGITFAKWGDTQSPYIVIPFMGPSTIRDGMGMLFDFSLFSVYPFIKDEALAYSLVGLRYVQLRSELLDTDRLMAQALDPYSFVRDAYLQHRAYLINGKQIDSQHLYIDDEDDDDTPATRPRLPLRA